MRLLRFLCIALLLFVLTVFLHAQTDDSPPEALRFIRLVWGGGENALRYAVEIDKLEDNDFQNHIFDFTEELYFRVSLLPGEYRYRITPHDILDRPGESSQWVNFQVRQPVNLAGETEGVLAQITDDTADSDDRETNEINITENLETEDEDFLSSAGRSPGYNALGISLGTAFIDPLFIASLHGSYAPFREGGLQNTFIELGIDFGFISAHEDVDGYYSIYPFLHFGYFLPLNDIVSWYAGAGAGYMFGKYTFPYGTANVNVFGFNLTTGINLFHFLNISYTLRTNFSSASNKAAVGYVYRF